MMYAVVCLRDEAIGLDWRNIDVLGPFDDVNEADALAAQLRQRGEVAAVKRVMPAWAE